MIEKEEFFIARCDKCKMELKSDEGYIIVSKNQMDLYGELIWNRWKRKKEKWYCPKCQT